MGGGKIDENDRIKRIHLQMRPKKEEKEVSLQRRKGKEKGRREKIVVREPQ
jgi:hypothetical protein